MKVGVDSVEDEVRLYCRVFCSLGAFADVV